MTPFSTSRSSNRDLWISHIRLSDKSSRLHPRHVVPKLAQAHEPEVPVKVREWSRTTAIDPRLSPQKRSEKDFSMGIMLIDACRPYGWKDQNPLANRFDDAYKPTCSIAGNQTCRLRIRTTVGDQ